LEVVGVIEVEAVVGSVLVAVDDCGAVDFTAG
jgi:hypothetical protein